jgi:hypothetical protein
LVEAYHLYHSRNFIVVSLGTGYLQSRIDVHAANSWGKIGWLQPILSILMDGNADTICFETTELFGSSHYRFDVALGSALPHGEIVDEDFDDASPENIRALQDKAQHLIDLSAQQIRHLAERLNKPKTPLQPKDTLPPKGFLVSETS